MKALKNMPRTGWVQRGVPPGVAETVAAHMYEASLECLELGHRLAEKGFVGREDVLRAVAIVVAHDVGEALVGDLNRFVSDEMGGFKYDLELKAFSAIGSRILTDLFKEYSGKSSRASILAHVCDRISTLAQAVRYSGHGYDVSDIEESSRRDVDVLLRSLCTSRDCFEEVSRFIKDLLEDGAGPEDLRSGPARDGGAGGQTAANG